LEEKLTHQKPQKFVIIDDDDITIFLTTRILKQYNSDFEIIAFKDGKQAVQDFIFNGYEENWIVLLDINMPIYNGWDFLNEIEKHHIKINVFMFSSSIDARDQEKSKAYPYVLDYVSKPLTSLKIEKILSQI
jgi:response regulator of citrate/malate metabolism